MDHKKNYEEWLGSSILSKEEKQILGDMSEDDIYESFYKYAEFGTAGMRGIMGLGTNRLNRYTIRMASKGLAQMLGKGAKVAVAYDTRNNSIEFANETARVLAAEGIKVYLFDRYSPVPLLSYAVRKLKCDGGVVITASHNTKEYNGFKVYDHTGSQMSEHMADKIANNIAKNKNKLAIEVSSIDDKNIEYIGDDLVDEFVKTVGNCSIGLCKNVASNLNIVYTPLHGSGRDYVKKVLGNAGFDQLTVVEEQSEFNGEFPTVKKPNPEDTEAFTIAQNEAKLVNADIIIGTDPDCDRIGVGVVDEDEIVYLSGNQTGVLLIDFLARVGLPEGKKLITTIVTSDMGQVVAKNHGIEVIRTFTGFKNIGAEMNKISDDQFFMGYEESYGYLPGTHARDKDGVSSALIICEMAAYWKSQGKTLVEVLNELYKQYGYWIDKQQSFTFEGAAGIQKMSDIMNEFRVMGNEFLSELVRVDDYSKGIDEFPKANVLKFIFEGGSWIAIRPSGTEPKMKVYYCITASEMDKAEEKFDRIKEQIVRIVK